jgi:hypothetical protein
LLQVSLKSEQPAQTAQLAMHNFFIPSPSPMYEQPPDLEAGEHTALRKRSRVSTRIARDTEAHDQLESGPKVTKHGSTAVKPRLIVHDAIQDMHKPNENFAKSQHGIFDIFQDHSVPVSAKKAQAAAALQAKHKAVKTLVSSVIKRKTSLDEVQEEQDAHTSKPSVELVKDPTRSSAAVAAARLPPAAPAPEAVAAAVETRAGDRPAAQAQGPEARAASHEATPPKAGRATTIDYGGMFGDPFEDNAVDATAARQAQPSWF